MTMTIPFRNRGLRAQVEAQAKRIHALDVMVDDLIDVITGAHATVPTASEDTAAVTTTGHTVGQHWVPSAWWCGDPGIGLTVDQAHQVMREHLDCQADRATCRIKHQAVTVLAAAQVLVPDSHRRRG